MDMTREIISFTLDSIDILLFLLIGFSFVRAAVACAILLWGWSGGAKVLGKLSVPGRPTSLDDSRARAYCALQ